LKDKILKIIQETMTEVDDIEIISNKYIKCYEQANIFGERVEYYTSDLKYWLEQLERNE